MYKNRKKHYKKHYKRLKRFRKQNKRRRGFGLEGDIVKDLATFAAAKYIQKQLPTWQKYAFDFTRNKLTELNI